MSTPPAPAASTDETANKKVMSKQEKKLAETLEKGDLGKKGWCGPPQSLDHHFGANTLRPLPYRLFTGDLYKNETS